MLLVLKDYEDQELYEECALIRDALKKHRDEHSKFQPSEMITPKHINEYKSEKHQKILHKFGIKVDDKAAKEKAKLIKLKLPVNGIKL